MTRMLATKAARAEAVSHLVDFLVRKCCGFQLPRLADMVLDPMESVSLMSVVKFDSYAFLGGVSSRIRSIQLN